MNTTTVAPFNIIGLAIITTNENGQSAKDIPQLWNTFLSENIAAQIPGKTDTALYCIYTDYEKDHTKPYTTILGCKTDSLDNIPEGLTGKYFPGGNYSVCTAKGKITEGIVFKEWTKIWNSNIPRAYTADFEVYDEKAQHTDDAEVDIFISVK
jgi:predicted transcriptional regulator YdeE